MAPNETTGRKNAPLLYKGNYYDASKPEEFPDKLKEAQALKAGEATEKTERNVNAKAANASKSTDETSQEAGDKAPSGEDAGKIGGVPQALPSDFPSFQVLNNAGYTSLAAVVAAPDEDLLKLPGIGKATLAEIRKAAEEA